MAKATVLAGRESRREPEWLVLAVVLVALLLGWLLKLSVEAASARLEMEGFTLSYPASWVRDDSAGEPLLFELRDLRSGSTFATQVSGQALEMDQVPLIGDREQEPLALANAWSFRRAQEFDSYRVLSLEETTVGGAAGARVDFAYVAEPGSAFRATLPVVVRATDFLVPRGERLVVLTVAADAARYDEVSPALETIINSVALDTQ